MEEPGGLAEGQVGPLDKWMKPGMDPALLPAWEVFPVDADPTEQVEQPMEAKPDDAQAGAEHEAEVVQPAPPSPKVVVKEELEPPSSGKSKQLRLGSFFRQGSDEDLGEVKQEVKQEVEQEVEQGVKQVETRYTREDYQEWGRAGGLKRKKGQMYHLKKPQQMKRFQPGNKEKLDMIKQMKVDLGPAAKPNSAGVVAEPPLKWFRSHANERYKGKCSDTKLREIWRSEAELLQWRAAQNVKNPNVKSRYARGTGAKKHTKRRQGPMDEAKQSLKAKVEKEEQHYGHELDPDDIFDMWKEEIAERLLDLKMNQKKAELRAANPQIAGNGLVYGYREYIGYV